MKGSNKWSHFLVGYNKYRQIHNNEINNYPLVLREVDVEANNQGKRGIAFKNGHHRWGDQSFK